MNLVPIILGGYVNGYSLARAFYETYGISSIIYDHKKQFSRFSSFIDFRLVEDPKHDITLFIQHLSKELLQLLHEGKKLLVLATNDEWLIPISKQKAKIPKDVIIPIPDWEIITNLTIKDRLYSYCEEIGIPYPKTVVIKELDETALRKLRMPVLIKPTNVVEYITLFPSEKRNHIYRNYSALYKYINDKRNRGYTGSMIAQEYIDSGIQNLYTITTYSDRYSRLKGISIGHKLSQEPSQAGMITCGYTRYDSRLIEPARKILEGANYYGISNIEFKFDIEENQYKLIEVNPRPGIWNYAVNLSGLNLVRLLVEDFVYKKKIRSQEGKKNLVWTILNSKITRRICRENGIEPGEVGIFDPRINQSENIRYKIHLRIRIIGSCLKQIYKKVLNTVAKWFFNIGLKK